MSEPSGIRRTLDGLGRLAPMAAEAHICQSVADVLTTPIGTRVMRPGYGSRLPRLVDQPVTPTWRLEVYAAVIEALQIWEPRIRVDLVRVAEAGAGYLMLDVEWTRLANDTTQSMEIRVGWDGEAKS